MVCKQRRDREGYIYLVFFRFSALLLVKDFQMLGHWEPRNKVMFISLAEHLAGCKMMQHA